MLNIDGSDNIYDITEIKMQPTQRTNIKNAKPVKRVADLNIAFDKSKVKLFKENNKHFRKFIASGNFTKAEEMLSLASEATGLEIIDNSQVDLRDKEGNLIPFNDTNTIQQFCPIVQLNCGQLYLAMNITKDSIGTILMFASSSLHSLKNLRRITLTN